MSETGSALGRTPRSKELTRRAPGEGGTRGTHQNVLGTNAIVSDREVSEQVCVPFGFLFTWRAPCRPLSSHASAHERMNPSHRPSGRATAACLQACRVLFGRRAPSPILERRGSGPGIRPMAVLSNGYPHEEYPAVWWTNR